MKRKPLTYREFSSNIITWNRLEPIPYGQLQKMIYGTYRAIIRDYVQPSFPPADPHDEWFI